MRYQNTKKILPIITIIIISISFFIIGFIIVTSNIYLFRDQQKQIVEKKALNIQDTIENELLLTYKKFTSFEDIEVTRHYFSNMYKDTYLEIIETSESNNIELYKNYNIDFVPVIGDTSKIIFVYVFQNENDITTMWRMYFNLTNYIQKFTEDLIKIHITDVENKDISNSESNKNDFNFITKELIEVDKRVIYKTDFEDNIMENFKIHPNFDLVIDFDINYLDGPINKAYTNLLLYLGFTTFIVFIMSFLIYVIVFQRKVFLFSNRKLKMQNKYYIKITKKGKIVKFNSVFKENVKNYKYYTNIRDFKIHCGTECSLILSSYKSFNIEVENNNGEIMFLDLNVYTSFFHLNLIGENRTQEVKKEDEIRSLAFHNPITNLLNLTALVDTIDKTVVREDKVAIVLLDILSFSGLNKVFGEILGNEALIKISSSLSKYVTDNISLYHIEIDVFAFLIKGIDNNQSIETFVKTLANDATKPIEVSRNQLIIKYKIGVYNSGYDNEKDANEIIKKANHALKKAKSSRTSSYVFYDDNLGNFLTRRNIIEADLNNAIEKDEFVLFYQPQYSNKQKKIIGLEALLRWNNPKYINDSPFEYITIAEETNLINKIGPIILEKAFIFSKKIEHLNIDVSVNISMLQLYQSGFVNEVLELSKKYQVDPKKISLEITESHIMESFVDVISKLKLLKTHGFKIHLDDFGTGYSSLLYLKELPIDALKIDRGFIKLIETNKESRSIISMIIHLANTLELEVISEGVETNEQNSFLTSLKSDIIQGYLISKALDEEKVLKFIEEFKR